MRSFGQEINGKVAVITGAASGIGEAVAHIYCEFGCKVLGVDVNSARLAKVTEEIKATGGEFEAYVADVKKSRQSRPFSSQHSIVGARLTCW